MNLKPPNPISLLQIKKDTTLPLPLWLGTMLAVSPTTASQSTNLVTMDFPDPLRQRVLNALKADPCSVDLRAQAPHFYAVAARCLDLFEDDGVLDVLIDVRPSLSCPGLSVVP